MKAQSVRGFGQPGKWIVEAQLGEDKDASRTPHFPIYVDQRGPLDHAARKMSIPTDDQLAQP